MAADATAAMGAAKMTATAPDRCVTGTVPRSIIAGGIATM
jgi:hypothetical protein